ncbi:hypothetical protein SAMN02746062_01676 [Alysiella filiformis DSM 16848]|uniref:Uncharacterized protein n=2 Tax=Alysiella TaxID=194195 RepID=A0A286EET9_9NEIS|nr:hypothetical protein SAMN02746062_01676 [Alysiella filiformis DSM 16848]
MFFTHLNDFFEMLNHPSVELDEWYLADFIEQNVDVLQSHQAFDILVQFVSYLLQHDYGDFEYEIRTIIAALKRQADTNEIFWTEVQQNQFNHYFQAA